MEQPEAYDRPQTTQGYPFNTDPERPQEPTVVEQLPRQMSFPITQPPPGMTALLAVMKERMIAKQKAEGRYREPVMIVDGKEYVFYTDKDGRTNFRINETAWEPASASEPVGDESDRRGGDEAESGTSGSRTADSESADGGSSVGSGDDTSSS